MPNYAKFIKDVMSKKRKLQEFETMKLTEECSAILQKKLPQKLKDPRSFTIPCFIGGSKCSRALCDLGASINLMPFSIYGELELGEVKPNTITLQLADRSLTYPRGVVEDVLVKVDKFIFPADFVILDMKEDHDAPLIFGRPFLATGRALIDVYKGTSCLIGATGTVDEDDWEVKEQIVALDGSQKERKTNAPLEELEVHEQTKRRLNPAMKEVLKNEVLKLLNAGVIYAISDSSWVSHVQVVPKKGGIIVVRNENDELISTPSEDQEKTTFTCPYGTFAFRRMSFGLCNAPATFQRCMMAIFADMVEEIIEVFMDDFSRCQEKNLVRNLKKCNFMVQEGIVLGHKVSSRGLEVDRAKVFERIKKALVTAPIMIAPYWKEPFEQMRDAKFDFEVKDKKGSENQVADHLSRLELEEKKEQGAIQETFPDEQLFEVNCVLSWFADIANFLSCGTFPPDLSHHQKKKFFHVVNFLLWDDPFVYKRCVDQVIRRCMDGVEAQEILEQCHSSPYDGHFGAS
ncbi:uncharacterized protein LOC142537643 [Primulina tabacum]|uniref:uncharacterized protein LOC142537643 n=1 Tax=Primulina tabacum TaxID=48773 RepID=UPI003F5A2AB8